MVANGLAVAAVLITVVYYGTTTEVVHVGVYPFCTSLLEDEGSKCAKIRTRV